MALHPLLEKWFPWASELLACIFGVFKKEKQNREEGGEQKQ